VESKAHIMDRGEVAGEVRVETVAPFGGLDARERRAADGAQQGPPGAFGQGAQVGISGVQIQ